MNTKMLATAAAISLLGATAASAECNWGAKMTMAEAPMETHQMSKPVEVASVPVDAWLIKYLDGAKNA